MSRPRVDRLVVPQCLTHVVLWVMPRKNVEKTCNVGSLARAPRGRPAPAPRRGRPHGDSRPAARPPAPRPPPAPAAPARAARAAPPRPAPPPPPAAPPPPAPAPPPPAAPPARPAPPPPPPLPL